MKSLKPTDYLITANTTILIAYISVFQAVVASSTIKTIILISFILFLCSLILLIWYRLRSPKRDALFEQLREKAIDKSADGMTLFAKELIEPLAVNIARLDVHHKMMKVSSPEEYEQVKKELSSKSYKGDNYLEVKNNKAIRTIIESFLQNIDSDTKEAYKKAYKKPLKEKHAKAKHFLDMIAYKIRIHLLVGGGVLLAFAIILTLLMVR